MVDYQTVRSLLEYDAKTGKLYWKARPVEMFKSQRACSTWNSRYCGKEALSYVDIRGYKHGKIFNRAYLTHRIVWLLVCGELPEIIDHLNGDTSDNRFENLRSVAMAENQKNLKLSRRNKSGAPGVRQSKKDGKWEASITSGGRTERLGRFEEKQAAVGRRKAAEIERGFHPNHGRTA